MNAATEIDTSQLEAEANAFSVEAGLSDAVASIARHFGVAVRPETFASLARNGDGVVPFHQAEFALDLAGMRAEGDEQRRLSKRGADYPALVALTDGSIVGVMQIADGDALVSRGASAEPQWISIVELQQEFAGRFLSVSVNPDTLRKAADGASPAQREHWFWGELKRERWAYRPVIVASLLINVLALSLPLFSMTVYDRIIPNSATASLWVLAIGVALAIGLEYALRLARAKVVDQIGRRLDLRLSQKIFSRLMATPLATRQGHTGSLAARVADYQVVRDFFASTTVVLMVDMAFLFVFVIAIAYIAGWLAMVPLVAMTLMAITGLILQKRAVKATRDAQTDHSLQQTMLVETLSGMETVKAMNGEGAMIGRWRTMAELGARSQARLRDVATAATSLTTTFQQVSTVSLVIGGYYLFDAGIITMGAIIAIVMLASRSLAPAGQIAFTLTRWRQARDTLSNIETLFDADDERRTVGGVAPLSASAPVITMAGVDFSYPGAAQRSLREVNLAFEPGERVAIIGRVASGKSTLGRVLCGLYKPDDGAVLIDGQDSREIAPSVHRDALRFVGQDAVLFTGSVRDNLAMGQQDLTDAELTTALRATGADVMLTGEHGSIAREIGERGQQLSGGQRSLLSVSRALVRPGPLLFLDEPTGAMDSETEKLFCQRLEQGLSPEQTLIVATHRPALFKLCNRIVVLDKGRVVDDGPVEKFMQRHSTEGGQMP